VHYTDAVAHMALEMQAQMDQYRRRSGGHIQVRIGIGTGPIVAGVIGKKKFIYDMWGDTVNVAFRMAADAHAGAVQVDFTTYRRLQHRFRFDEVHEVDIKGKGRMQIFRLVGPLEAGAPSQAASRA
jgi:class 3 adenylate cyclase